MITEQITRSLFEEIEPSIEVSGVDWQWQMHAHRLTVVGAARQHDRRPKCAHALQVRFPVLNARIEDGPEQVISADASIEPANELFDHCFIDAGLFAHLLNYGGTTFFICEGSVGHLPRGVGNE
nr:hypothetical protein [Peristeroidobacter agariperforans]